MTAASPYQPGKQAPDVEVAIIGTGFAGLCMAIRLKEDGIDNFVLIERGSSVGGTWRDNHYPGAACDVPSHLYSLSFEPNADWSRTYPTQPELYSYLKSVAAKHELAVKTRFNTTFLGADYDEGAQLWHVKTSTGTLTARSLVSGNGGLAELKLPDIKGVTRFKGKTFHSSQWDHSYDLSGKRVAVIGTGASAIQLVPAIARKVAHLDLYQRTPNWIIPRADRAYTALEKTLFKRLPIARELYRAGIYWSHEARVLGMVIHPSLMKVFQRVAERHIAKQVRDPVLRQKVTPDYTIGCKRVLISNDWYPAIGRDNVDVVTTGIKEIRDNAVVASDGTVREVDVIIYATGFYATENPIADVIRGRGGKSLAECWVDGEEAYQGTLVSGFPNLYFIVGPNTGLGHNSMVYMIESQVEYIRKLLAHRQQARAASIEVKPEVQSSFNARLQQRLQGSIWATGGCSSWYKHRSGKITALWPDFTFRFRQQLNRFRPADYILEAPRKTTAKTH